MKVRLNHGLILAVICAVNVQAQVKLSPGLEARLFAEQVFNLSEVMVHDVANPPAAARFYAYALFGAYQIASLRNPSLSGLNSALQTPLQQKVNLPPDLNFSFCANYTLLEVGKRMMPSGYMLAEKQQELTKYYRNNRWIKKNQLAGQVTFCERVAESVVAYAAEDNYRRLPGFPRYTPLKGEGYWYPTPPEYMPPVEPQWHRMRTFFMERADQFAPPPAAVYSSEKDSEFFKQMLHVYETVLQATPEQIAIANFWDCNPFAVEYSGHMAIGIKKISPGGHWISITGIACAQAALPLDSTILVHAMVGLTLHDAFVSCWQEKYHSHRIRPETAINKLIDPAWRPILQTPPFPEYTSGHSVASASAAEILTAYLGDNFAYRDTSEVYFNLPPRDFTSFRAAAAEAAISRLYGGIHFIDACTSGTEQGKQIGQYILRKIQSK